MHFRKAHIHLVCLTAAILVSAPSWAMRFSHKVHSDQGAQDCFTCHRPGDLTIIPEREVCLDCHTDKELAETVLGPARTHTPLWVRQHGRESTDPGAQCALCHSVSFCSDCHRGGDISPNLSRRTIRTDTVPRTHTSRFRVIHPLKAIGVQADACYTCHTREYCSDCHAATPPDRLKILSHRESWTRIEAGAGGPLHLTFALDQCRDCHPGGALSSKDWSGGHAQEARRSLSSCQTCHPNGEACMDCHSAENGLQVSPHPKNWRSIQRKFRGESPETCARCHAAGSF